MKQRYGTNSLKGVGSHVDRRNTGLTVFTKLDSEEAHFNPL